MDISLLGAASTALTAAREIGRAAIGVRDFNALATVVSQLNEQILKAQDALFSHQTQLMALHEELVQTKEKLRLAEQMVQERGRYGLFELSPGVYVYRFKPGEASAVTAGSPIHYLCQPCFDAGRKMVLVRTENYTQVNHVCPHCKVAFLERNLPEPPLRRGADHYPY